MQHNVIEVHQVKRDYITKSGKWKKTKTTVEAVKEISFEVKKGEIFGLLGPNGAGKTTTIKMLTTMLLPSEGRIKVLGFDVAKDYKKLRSHINFILGGERNLYWRLSAYDNLAYFADLYKIPRSIQKEKIPALLKLVELEEAGDRLVETFSKGMKQRLQIARGLLNDPQILFLDEPSIGLDPVSARKLRKILRELNNQGTTILLTTHYMYEADELCDRIAFINKGEIVAIDTPENLKSKMANGATVECTLQVNESFDLAATLERKGYDHMDIDIQDAFYKVKIQCKEPQECISHLFELNMVQIVDLSIMQTSLEDAYVQLIGGEVS